MLKNLSSTATFQLIDNFERSFSFGPWFPRGAGGEGADIAAGSRPLSYANSSDQRSDRAGQLNGPNLLPFTVIYFQPGRRRDLNVPTGRIKSP